METSVSLLQHLAGTPTDDDWRRLLDLYQPLLRAWMARAGVSSCDVDDLTQEVLLVVFREVRGFERRGQGAFRAWLRTILAHRTECATTSAGRSTGRLPPAAATACGCSPNWSRPKAR